MLLEVFSAVWCAPCRGFHDVVDEVSAQSGIPAVWIDVDVEPARASDAGVLSLPTVRLLEGGLELKRRVGACGVDALVRDLGLA